METIRRIDNLGRLFLPQRWCKTHGATTVGIREVGDSLKIPPLPPGRLGQFVESIVVEALPQIFRDPPRVGRSISKDALGFLDSNFLLRTLLRSVREPPSDVQRMMERPRAILHRVEKRKNEVVPSSVRLGEPANSVEAASDASA